MKFALLFVLLFGVVASTLATSCFSGIGNLTILNPSCTGSATLEVGKEELLVDFKWNGTYTSRAAQKLTFVFGGCSVVARQTADNKPQFEIKNKPRYLPLTFVVERSKVVVKSTTDTEFSIKCTSSFEKIPDSSAFKINITYTAPPQADLKDLNVNLHGTIYEVESNDKVYEKAWFWIVIALICMLIVGSIITGIVIYCCIKRKKVSVHKEEDSMDKVEFDWTKTNAWEWPVEPYTPQQLELLMSFFPLYYTKNIHLHNLYAKSFLQKHPLNEKQFEVLKKEMKKMNKQRRKKPFGPEKLNQLTMITALYDCYEMNKIYKERYKNVSKKQTKGQSKSSKGQSNSFKGRIKSLKDRSFGPTKSQVKENSKVKGNSKVKPK
ncbi:hypothetical protein M3Y95_00344400 [Aphelenchoides besseyi]|nr:hypothetical protein M3Y95_00344400 [Aphelenchoides besseyi]